MTAGAVQARRSTLRHQRPLSRQCKNCTTNQAIFVGHLLHKAQFFKRRFGNHPNIRIHEVCLEQVLRSVDAARRFLVSIGLEPTPASDFVLMSNDTNSRVEKKHGELANVTYTQQRIDAFVARYRERNMWLPVAPHADAAYCAKPL